MTTKITKPINALQSFFISLTGYLRLLILEAVCVTLSLLLSIYFHFDGEKLFQLIYMDYLPVYAAVGLVLSSGIMLVVQCYETNIIKFNIVDAIKMGLSLLIGYTVYFMLNQILVVPLPDTVLINYFFINTLLFGLYRLVIRAGYWLHSKLFVNILNKRKPKNILIVGAGSAGQYLYSMLMYNNDGNRVVGFIDDDENLRGRRIKGLKVFGGRESIPIIAEKYDVNEIIIAIPFVDNSTIRDIFSYCAHSNSSIKRFANMTNMTEAGLSKATINDVKLEDLLFRTQVNLDMDAVQQLIKGKTVLVTGGAGSIGSEICRQVLGFSVGKLIIFDFNENGLFDIGNALANDYAKEKYVTVLGSVRDEKRLEEVFSEYSPEIVFHAAAHKHVPMMELNPFEALINNSIGTYTVAKCAKAYNVERFILISTDKAVNPTNYMGASKRIAEMVIQYMNINSSTIFSAVRFGNVLGSNGSVFPLFKKQIEKGGPVTVTDRHIRRYFMTIPEAVQLVLQAGAMAAGSEIFVLNMGEPVCIYDMACTMIRLCGLIPDKDIKIDIVGLRDGEKLYEEINLCTENLNSTNNDKIFILKSEPVNQLFIHKNLDSLSTAIRNRDRSLFDQSIKTFVPEFNHPNVREKEIKTIKTPTITPNFLEHKENMSVV